jgi:hypothetical protein
MKEIADTQTDNQLKIIDGSSEYGTIKLESATLTLVQDAYRDNNNQYTAYAKDENDDNYVIVWQIINMCKRQEFKVYKL